VVDDDTPIELSSWETNTVSFRLGPADPGEVRSADTGQAVPLGSEHEPRVELPTSSFACVRLDALKDHPAVDGVLRAEMAEGVSFRMLRFPFSLRAPEAGRVTEARYTVELTPDGAASPTVYSIYPQRLEVESDKTTEAALEPKLSIGQAVEIGVGRVGRSVVVRQGRATTIGYWSEQGAEWELRSLGSSQGIEGTWEFLAVVRWPRDVSPLRLSISLSATVATTKPIVFWRTRRIVRNYEPISLEGCLPVA
jgi:hypothetical protein